MKTKLLQHRIPGVLSREQLQQLCGAGWIESVKDMSLIDYSAINLTLTDEAYEMVQGSVKPFGESYAEQVLRNPTFAKPLFPGGDGSFILCPKTTSVFKVEQQLGSRMKEDGTIFGQATARSSVGRVDVLARLIVDGMDSYEGFNPKAIQNASGGMFLEITPLTFPVKVRKGVSLSQLRLFCGPPEECEISGEALYKAVLISDCQNRDGSLSVDLSNNSVWGKKACAFKAKKRRHFQPIPLWKERKTMPEPADYWDLVCSKENLPTPTLRIEKDSFYILLSKEKIALPESIAVYCRATDETIGEMRIHYAGFAHPLFGRDRSDESVGTPLIFEVRGHDVGVSLTDGEKMARLTFYRMSENVKRQKGINRRKSDYEEQALQLSGFFKQHSGKRTTTKKNENRG